MYKRLLLISAIIICFIFLLSACGSPSVSSNSPAASNTQVSGTSASSPSSSPSTAPSTAAPEKAASAAFKYYTSVDIGMTKADVEQKTGLTGDKDTNDAVPKDQTGYYYIDANGDGIYVLFDKDSKLTSKTVQYADPAVALVPFTSKAVTKDECDKITDGMAHADVDKLLGSKGAECSKTQITLSGKTTIGTIYRWGNPDGSFIQVPFNSGDTANMAMYFDHQ